MSAEIIDMPMSELRKLAAHQETPVGQCELAMQDIELALDVLEAHASTLARNPWPHRDRFTGANVLLDVWERRLRMLRARVEMERYGKRKV